MLAAAGTAAFPDRPKAWRGAVCDRNHREHSHCDSLSTCYPSLVSGMAHDDGNLQVNLHATYSLESRVESIAKRFVVGRTPVPPPLLASSYH